MAQPAPAPTQGAASPSAVSYGVSRVLAERGGSLANGPKSAKVRSRASLGQFSLAWVLREPNVASAIVGASRPDQLDENAAASGLTVDPALFAQAEAIVANVRRAT